MLLFLGSCYCSLRNGAHSRPDQNACRIRIMPICTEFGNESLCNG